MLVLFFVMQLSSKCFKGFRFTPAGGAPSQDAFAAIDANNDGVITREDGHLTERLVWLQVSEYSENVFFILYQV